MICQKCFSHFLGGESSQIRWWGFQPQIFDLSNSAFRIFWGELSDDDVFCFGCRPSKLFPMCFGTSKKIRELSSFNVPGGRRIRFWWILKSSLKFTQKVIHSEQSPRKWLKPQSKPPEILTAFEPPKSWRGMVQMMDFPDFKKGWCSKFQPFIFGGSGNQLSWYKRFIAWIVQPWLSKILTTKIIP